MVAQKARSFVEVGPSGDPVDVENTTMVATEEPPIQANPNTNPPAPAPQPRKQQQAIGPISRTTTVVEKSHVLPAIEQGAVMPEPTANGVVSQPSVQNLAKGTFHYVPSQNEHDEPNWPNMFRPYAEAINRKFIDDIFRFNKQDFYQLSCAQSLPAGAAPFSGQLPEGPYEDIHEYLKSYSIQNGMPDAAYRIGVALMPSNKLVTSFIIKFGNANKILQNIQQDQDPELVEKEKELKKVKLDGQINAELNRGKPAPVPEKDPMTLVMAMQEASSKNTNALVTAFAPVLAAILTKPAPPPPPPPADSGVKEMMMLMMKMQNDTNKMMMDAQQKSTEMLMKALESKKSGSGEMDIFKMAEFMRNMKNDLREDLMVGQGDEDVEVDPNNITGSLMAEGVKGLIRLFKTGGPAIAAAVAQVAASAGKNPTALTDADEPAIRAALNIPPAPPRIATAQQQRKPIANVQPRKSIMDLPAPKTLDEIVEDAANAAEDLGVPSPVPNPSPNVVPMIPVAPAPAVPQTEETQALMKNDLEGEILLSLDTMIADIRSGRIEKEIPTWIEEAVARWHNGFLDELCKLEAPTQIMNAVKQVVGAKAWAPVDVALAEVSASVEGGVHYQFYMTFGALKEMWTALKETKKEEVKDGSAK